MLPSMDKRAVEAAELDHTEEQLAAKHTRLLASLTLIAGIGVIVGLPFALRAGAEFFLPVTAALVVAIALVPMLEWFERRGVPSKLAAVVCVVIFLLIMAFAIGSIVIPAMDWVVQVPERIGNSHPNIVPYQVFSVADGYIIIATGNDSQYQKLCVVLGAAELGKDPRYIDNKSRLANRAELIGKLTAQTMKFKMQDLADKLEAVGVPAGPINNLDQVFEDPHIKHRGISS